jgi:peptidoglycan pentaglycine glycine transferase (the first glycine)
MVRFRVVSTSPFTGEWEALLLQHSEAHLLQTPAWGQLKARHGWRAEGLAGADAGALILVRRPLPGLRLAYVPRGPFGRWDRLIPDLVQLARQRGAFVLILEPDVGDPVAADLPRFGFLQAARTIQPRSSLLVDLHGTEDELLARMNQKTRYNIGLARRRGVRVRSWEDPVAFAEMLRSTGDRQGFGVHTPGYYQDAFDIFRPRGECEILVAEAEDQPVASLMVFGRGEGSWYFYGASTGAHRDRMPTYLLQWEAMRWARRRGASWYDLWGVPDAPLDQLEAGFASRSDGLWGVYRFKRGFGGRLVRTPGAWELPLRKSIYTFYRRFGRTDAG